MFRWFPDKQVLGFLLPDNTLLSSSRKPVSIEGLRRISPQSSVLCGFRITGIAAMFLTRHRLGFHSSGPPIQDMGTDHGGSHVFVAEQFQDGAYVIAALEQVRG